jgi:hypothetical protein
VKKERKRERKKKEKRQKKGRKAFFEEEQLKASYTSCNRSSQNRK